MVHDGSCLRTEAMMNQQDGVLEHVCYRAAHSTAPPAKCPHEDSKLARENVCFNVKDHYRHLHIL